MERNLLENGVWSGDMKDEKAKENIDSYCKGCSGSEGITSTKSLFWMYEI